MNKSIANDLKIFARDLTILVVEDESNLRSELVSLLEHFFKKVYEANNGVEGLAIYKKYSCDIVITDLNMPKMNGVEFSKEVRILNKNQVIMVLSGYIDTFVIDLIDIGIQSLMLKPYDISAFMQKLLVHCENITLKNEFSKMLLNKTLEKTSDIKNSKPKIEVKKEVLPSTTEKIAQELLESKSTQDIKHDFSKVLNIQTEIDDTMWKHLSEEIYELNIDYEDLINSIALNGFNNNIKSELATLFSKYNSSLSLIPGLEKLCEIFNDLSIMLEDLNLEELSSNTYEVFDMFEYFYDDIIKFFNVIFVEKETKNINYLTDSLISSVYQLKVKLGIVQLEEDDELELF